MMVSYILSLLLPVVGENTCSRANACVGDAPNDTVSNMPYWGDVYTGNMYSGYLPINKSCNSAMFYWMLEKEGGSKPGETPVLLWLNGGPGASSIEGLLMENIGPYQIVDNVTFTYNEYAWTNKYNVLIIDNPVGTGYSYTDNKVGCYCTTEREVAKDFYIMLKSFFKLHSEYSTNPLYLTGESYAGKYIPNIAEYLMVMNFPFEGVILGNGLYWAEKQYKTVPEFALNLGILSNQTYETVMPQLSQCIKLIQDGENAKAFHYCENMVDYIYNELGGGVWVYDVREYHDPTPETSLTSYLNSAEVQSALHTTGHTWTTSDESGPVSDALIKDAMIVIMPQLESLLIQGYNVILYNGGMDGSACNNVGNSWIVDLLNWVGQDEFHKVEPELWRLDTINAIGFRRAYKNLAYVTFTNAGHMVPMTQPMHFRIFLDDAVAGKLTQSKK